MLGLCCYEFNHNPCSVCQSVTNIFHHTFLSNYASQPPQTWYGASAMGPTRCLPNSLLPLIYFLFYDLFSNKT